MTVRVRNSVSLKQLVIISVGYLLSIEMRGNEHDDSQDIIIVAWLRLAIALFDLSCVIIL